ncbi:uncharacterized protein MONBRDRAFT_11269 [Monosiga brevicollis MX1]|uniref:Uncharacterized protein n=1 Tax=Monosiga brevicollis TaxID=81824 RepID=A9V8Q3_MONBE|nr:uncharacterized protein MONBRDRAFT_11269 [Monosiga brevicollis MX1]EDQ86183.1 predicted protein [Monosiga brevicollis MX1]|eukprot:XP_001749108.1 hypothetical protein [Monosiga brevicollis MX1]
MDVPSPLSQQPPQDDLSSRLSNVEELLAQKEEQSSKRIQEQKMQLNSLQALKGKDENRPASEQHDVLAKVAQLEEAVKQCSEGVNHATLKAEAESNKKSIKELRAAMEKKDEENARKTKELRAAMEKKDEENARKTEELRAAMLAAMEQKDNENARKTEELRAAMLAAMEQKDEQLQELRATTDILQRSVDEIAEPIRKREMARCLSNWLLWKLHANEMQWGGPSPLIIDLANFLNVFFNLADVDHPSFPYIQSCYMQASPGAQWRMRQAYIEVCTRLRGRGMSPHGFFSLLDQQRLHGNAAAHPNYYRIMPAEHLASVYQEKAATDPVCAAISFGFNSLLN